MWWLKREFVCAAPFVYGTTHRTPASMFWVVTQLQWEAWCGTQRCHICSSQVFSSISHWNALKIHQSQSTVKPRFFEFLSWMSSKHHSLWKTMYNDFCEIIIILKYVYYLSKKSQTISHLEVQIFLYSHALQPGSWDYTIRVWDTRDGTCLDTAYDHGADVYGKTDCLKQSNKKLHTFWPNEKRTNVFIDELSMATNDSEFFFFFFLFNCVWGLTCHQSRPFTMASCSRDSTVRLWSLTPVVSPLLLNILTGQPWEKIIGNTGENHRPVVSLTSQRSL